MTAALHQANRVEAVDGRIEENAQWMVGQAIKAEEEGDKNYGNKGEPKARFWIKGGQPASAFHSFGSITGKVRH